MKEKLIRNLEDQLVLKDFKLHSLLEVTNAINANEGVDRLIQIFSFILKEQLGFTKFVLYNHQTEWNCLLRPFSL
jgi:sigma-B regulation protein RsbU (phosphoserine phosphatase)